MHKPLANRHTSILENKTSFGMTQKPPNIVVRMTLTGTNCSTINSSSSSLSCEK